MRSTQKEIVAYGLGHYISQTAAGIAADENFPVASVRRVLSELVAAGMAKFKKRDLFGNSGYVRAKR